MNNSFNEKIDRINIAKENIKTSLVNKGLNPSDNIEDYASLIENITSSEGEGSTIRVYDSIEAMEADKANMQENDVCEIYTTEQYYLTLDYLTEVTNVIIPASIVMSAISGMTSGTVKFENQTGSEYIQFKKSILNTKVTVSYKLEDQDAISLTYTYSDTDGMYSTTLDDDLKLEFNNTLSLTTDRYISSFISAFKSAFSKTSLTYVYKYSSNELKALQGFNSSVATLINTTENVSLGKTGDIAVQLIKANESIKPDLTYKYITFKPEIKKQDIIEGDYSLNLGFNSGIAGMTAYYVLEFIVTDKSINISLGVRLMDITAASWARVTYTLKDDTYVLDSKQVWEISGIVDFSVAGAFELKGLTIDSANWQDVYNLILNATNEFKGIYEYDLAHDRLYYLPTQLNAEASHLLEGKIAYSDKGCIEGTIKNLGTLEVTPTSSPQLLNGGYASSIKVKAVTSEIDENIQPDNIKSGVKILGVEGSDRLSVIKFNSLEEAQAYDKFKFNDKAIIIDTVDVPFYPDFLHTDYPNYSSYSYSGSMQELLYEPFILLPRDQVTLDEITALSAEASYTTSGNKPKTYGFKIEISSSECWVTVFSSFLGSNDVIFKYKSTDGLTYTLNEVTNNGSTVTYIKYASLYWSSSYLGYVYDALIENWDNIKLISKFLYYPQKEQLKGIYTYLPASSISTNNTPFYLIDLNKVIYKNNAARLSLLEKSYTGQQFIDYATAAGLTDVDRGYAILKDGRVIMTNYPLIIKDNKGNYFFGSSNSATSHTIYNPADGTVTTGTNVEGYNYGPYTGMKIIDISEVEVIVRRTSYDSATKWANPAIYYVEDTSQTNTTIYGIYGGYYAKSNPQLIPFDGYRSDLNINDLLINGASSISAQEEIELNEVLDSIYGGAE